MIDDQTLIGHKLDQRYIIHELIARGGMASVYRATDERLERVVAVKIMHPNNSQMTDSEQFTREAKLAARLNHSGIVAMFDQGTDGNLTYLVMEYVPGKTLRDVMREEAPMTPRRALAYLEPVLVALSQAHAAGLIHRDMKPENVLISSKGEVKVADFGLARAASVDHRTSSVLIGTVSYLAPEVITQQAVDPRADIYACGAIFFEMITGRKPHSGDSPIAVAHKHINEDVVPPSSLVPGIPPYVDALALRALARDRGQRSPDAQTFLYQVRMVQQALSEGLADDPELTRDLLPGAGPTPQVLPMLPGQTSDTEATTPVILPDSQVTAHVPIMSDAEHTRTFDGVHNPVLPDPSNQGLPPPARKESKRGQRLLIATLVLFLLAGLFGWWLGIGRYEETPDVLNMSQAEAVKTIEAAGFKVEFAPESFSEEIPKGSVVASGPQAGERILPGDTISLTISKGKERYKIPKVEGKTLDEVSTILGSLNLQLGNVSEEWHDTIPEGSVIRSSSHKVGQSVKRDTAVDLVTSKGPAPVDIVNYTGKKGTLAKQKLEEVGLKVTVKQAFHDTIASGIVISQSPRSGTGKRGDTITLTVSKGPELFTVPNLEGLTEARAREIVENLGLAFNPNRNIFAGPRATVKYQSPAAGKKVKRGSTVTVFIS